MEQESCTTAEAVKLCDAVLSSISHRERDGLSNPEMILLMAVTRRFSDRAVSLASVVTDEVARRKAAESSTGTPLTDILGMDEGRDASEAARQVFDARDVNANETTRDLALEGVLSPRHAAAITKGMGQLPAALTTEQKARAEQSFIRRASKNTPKALAGMAGQVLAEIAPELVPPEGDDDAALVAQRRRARAKRHFKWGDDGDGSMWFKGSLPHLEAAPLIATLQAYVESDRRAERDRLKATRATQPDPRLVQDQVADDNLRTPDQRRADALTQIIADLRDAPTTIGDVPRIVITIRAGPPRGGRQGRAPGQWGEDPRRGPTQDVLRRRPDARGAGWRVRDPGRWPHPPPRDTRDPPNTDPARRGLYLPGLYRRGHPLRSAPHPALVGGRGHRTEQFGAVVSAPPHTGRAEPLPTRRRPMANPHRPPHRETRPHRPGQDDQIH